VVWREGGWSGVGTRGGRSVWMVWRGLTWYVREGMVFTVHEIGDYSAVVRFLSDQDNDHACQIGGSIFDHLSDL
jgi:hypothetical protein